MIKIRKANAPLPFRTWHYPGGEIGVRLDTENYGARYMSHPYTIWARLQYPADIMELLLLVDALRRYDDSPINLVLPYVPYGRQDRVCYVGESLSIKVFADLINGLKVKSVITFDPHSDVTCAALDRCIAYDQKKVIGNFDSFNALLCATKRPVFVSPDAGANKKVADLAGFYEHKYFIRADKLRDLATGKIKEIAVVNPQEDVEGQDCVIVDDLIDGGGTFVGLAAALKAKGAAKVILYATHGIFSKGTKVLYEGGMDEIYTTNSFYDVWPAGIDNRVNTLKLEEVFSL